MSRIESGISRGASWGITGAMSAGVYKVITEGITNSEPAGPIAEWAHETEMFTLMAEVGVAAAVLGFLVGVVFPKKEN